MFTTGPAFFFSSLPVMQTTLVIEDLPVELQNISTETAIRGWLHPTNSYSVPYILDGELSGFPGKMIFHPGPNLERPTVRWVNTGNEASFSMTLVLTPDGQNVPNTASLIRAGQVIGVATAAMPFSTTLTLSAGEALEITLSGEIYHGGGDIIDFTITKTSTGEVFDMYQSFVANQKAPSAMWQYFYRSNVNYPNGAINSAGPMIKE